MKYTPELTEYIQKQYAENVSVEDIVEAVNSGSSGLEIPEEPLPVRSVIAKLSSLGIYRKKQYLTKRGEPPIKKEEYIDRIAVLLEVNPDILESLEKVNKSVLALLEKKLTCSTQ
jgi:hypothetical protein